jgi:hypothetical protein
MPCVWQCFAKRSTPRAATPVANIDSDLADSILTHVPIQWTDAFREAEDLGKAHTETLGIRGLDLLHAGIALALGAKRFLTFDSRQVQLAKAAGMTVKF